MIKTISFIGSGNVATRFAIEFRSVGIKINNIFSRNQLTGKKLAKRVLKQEHILYSQAIKKIYA